MRGFSLVELSIVLVILGLLTGGILTGQSLIRASELRAVTTEYQKHVAAVQTFRDKYFAIPGDMRNATSFWGVLNATPATCRTTASTSALTCDGTGDGQLVDTAGSIEFHRFWQHLANAGLIEGTYTGTLAVTVAWSTTPGVNVPRSKLSNSGWVGLTWPATSAPNAYNFTTNYGNSFTFGATVADDYQNGAVLKPEEAWNIDSKLDDGLPGRGKVLAQRYTTCTNAASQSDLAATYLLATTTVVCSLTFPQAF